MSTLHPSQVAVIKVGMDLSGSQWGNDLTRGPGYLLKNGLEQFLRSKFHDRYKEYTVNAMPAPEQRDNQEVPHLDDILRISKDVQVLTQQLFREEAFVILLGGEQTADLGLVAGAATSGPANHLSKLCSVTSLDGHLDCLRNTDSITCHVHGQTMAAHCGYGQKDLVGFHGKSKRRVKPENVIIIGPNTKNQRFFAGTTTVADAAKNQLRNETNALELQNAKEWGITVFPVHALNEQETLSRCKFTRQWETEIREKLIDVIRRTRGHLVLCDLDHLRESDAPGVAMRNPEGMRLDQSLRVIDNIAYQALGKLWGVALVETDPLHDIHGKTVDAAVQIVDRLTQNML